MIISNMSIQHRTTVMVMIVIIAIAGMMAYTSLPRESAPDIKVSMVTVTTPYEGASPADIESLITRPIERKLKNLTDVEKLTSTSSEGLSMISIEFTPDVAIDTALQKTRDKVDEAKADLPDDLEPDPIVKEVSFSEIFPVLFVNIAGDVGLPRLKKIAEDMEEEVEAIRGVLDAAIIGDLEREIRVEFDQDRVAGYGLTMAEIVQTIAANNINTPGGSIDIGEAKYSLKVPAEFTSPDEIDNLVVAVRDGQPVYLTDIARIIDTYKDRTSFSRVNGAEAVSLRVTKRSGENLLRIATDIKAVVSEYRQRLPEQVKFTITSDSSKEVNIMVSDLENNILSGLVLVLVVIFVALGFRNAVLVALAIPFSMLISFFVIQAFGMTLNMIVLFSLVLALGMLVDNAIVIVENIYRHHTREGKPIVQAAMEATSEVAWPVIGSTATTVVAFLPLVFWPGVMGQFMSYLPKTVIITLLASLFVALVITPTLGAIFIHASRADRARPLDRDEEPKRLGPILRAYRVLLGFGLRYRVLALFFFFALLVIAVFAFGQSGLGVEMFPDTEPRRITVDITAPEGTNIYRTNVFARQAEAVIEKYGNIDFVTTAVGEGSGSGSGANTARIIIDMVDRENRLAAGGDGKIYFRNSNDTLMAMRDELTAAIVGAEVIVDKEKQGPPVGAPVNVEIAGDDYAMLARLAKTLRGKIESVPGVVDLKDDYQAGLPEVSVLVDKERAALLGLNAFAVGQLVKAAVNGIKIGDYREAEDEYDITARLMEEQRQHLEDVLRLRVPDPQGNQVPLTSVARIRQSSGLSAIKHIDQKRVVTVSSNVAKGFNAQGVLAEVRQRASQIPLPSGYRFSYTGENEEMEESQAFMAKAFITAILLIAFVLVMQFDSIVAPLIIMTSVILSFIGVFLGLLLTNRAFGVIMTGMGVISLAGVVVNNAIVLIDYINVLRRRGLPCNEAIVRAGLTRFRPVLLTAITTILGLIPMAIGVSFDFREMAWIVGSESAQWWGAMATAVIFGLAVATALTLFVVPNLYSLLFDFRQNSLKEDARNGEPVASGAPAPEAV